MEKSEGWKTYAAVKVSYSMVLNMCSRQDQQLWGRTFAADRIMQLQEAEHVLQVAL